MSDTKPIPSTIIVDSQGFVFAEGVRVGRLSPNKNALQILDKDRRRCEARGSRFVEVPIAELARLTEK